MVTAKPHTDMRPSPDCETSIEYLEKLRSAEIACVRNHFRPGSRILELGGGSGFQASLMAAWGCEVQSYDVHSQAQGTRLFAPVTTYDGKTLPVPERSVDVVFSSNVLEHITSLKETFQEVLRVLKPDGIAAHILPTPAWRFWSSVGRYGQLARRMWHRHEGGKSGVPVEAFNSGGGLLAIIKRALPIAAHGAYPNAAAELYYFSRRRWLNVFHKAGFQILSADPAGIFYTGYEILPSLTMDARHRLASLLGSACTVFVMRPACQ